MTDPKPYVPRARATLAEIRNMRSQSRDESDPERVIRIGLAWNREVWNRVKGAGASATYELQGGE